MVLAKKKIIYIYMEISNYYNGVTLSNIIPLNNVSLDT